MHESKLQLSHFLWYTLRAKTDSRVTLIDETYRVPWSEVAHLFERDSLSSGTADNDSWSQGLECGPNSTPADVASWIGTAERRHAAIVRHARQCKGTRGHVCPTCGRGRVP